MFLLPILSPLPVCYYQERFPLTAIMKVSTDINSITVIPIVFQCNSIQGQLGSTAASKSLFLWLSDRLTGSTAVTRRWCIQIGLDDTGCRQFTVRVAHLFLFPHSHCTCQQLWILSMILYGLTDYRGLQATLITQGNTISAASTWLCIYTVI